MSAPTIAYRTACTAGPSVLQLGIDLALAPPLTQSFSDCGLRREIVIDLPAGTTAATARMAATLEEASWLRSYGMSWARVADQLKILPATLAKAIERGQARGWPVPA